MSIEQQPLDIDKLLRDSVLTVIQLKEGADIADFDQLYKQCKQQINKVREELHDAQYSHEVIEDISYAICALLDETALLKIKTRGLEKESQEWTAMPLQVFFFTTNNAGETLFEKIRARLKADRKEQIVLHCFDRVLGLGFQGAYLGQPQMEREHLILALREAIREKKVEQSHPIIQRSTTYRYWGRKALLLFFTSASIIAVVALYFLLNQRLEQLILPLLG